MFRLHRIHVEIITCFIRVICGGKNINVVVFGRMRYAPTLLMLDIKCSLFLRMSEKKRIFVRDKNRGMEIIFNEGIPSGNVYYG